MLKHYVLVVFEATSCNIMYNSPTVSETQSIFVLQVLFFMGRSFKIPFLRIAYVTVLCCVC